MADFRKLRVWHAARRLAVDAHPIALKLRRRGELKRSDQLDRAAQSVPSNIVEGSAHSSNREFNRFLGYSVASASEVEGHAQLARDLDLISEEDFKRLLQDVIDVRMMLHGLIKKLKGEK